jgi:peptidoglycan hydrolase-like protein with peptidoglycan-binding domain
VTSVNFNLAVGTVVPSRVRIMTVPAAIVEIRPEFRGHQYFVVRDEIVILDNRRRIVSVIPTDAGGGRGAAVRGGSTDIAIDLSPEEIREVQLVLIERGFSVETDGVFGPRTRQALIQFQQRQGLQATGRIDSRTITELGVSARSGQDGGADRQPSTTGQGGTGRGDSGRDDSRGADQRAPQGSERGSGDETGATQQRGQGESSTTGQGKGSDQRSPANQGAGQGSASNPSANPPPRNSGGEGGGSMPRDRSK